MWNVTIMIITCSITLQILSPVFHGSGIRFIQISNDLSITEAWQLWIHMSILSPMKTKVWIIFHWPIESEVFQSHINNKIHTHSPFCGDLADLSNCFLQKHYAHQKVPGKFFYLKLTMFWNLIFEESILSLFATSSTSSVLLS